MTSCSATLIGDEVPRDFQGRATAVAHRACYLRNDGGQQVVLLADSLPPAAHGINVHLESGDFREVVARDSRARIEDGVLTITGAMGTRARIRLDDADIYHGTIADVVPGHSWERKLARRAVLETAEQFCSSSGMSAREEATHRRIRGAVERLADASRVANAQRSAMLAVTLIEYRTRSASGRMALVGYLGGLKALGKYDGPVKDTLANVETRDASPDWGYLDAAAVGHFPEPVRTLAESMLAGIAEKAVEAAVRCFEAYDALGLDTVAGVESALTT